MKVNLAPEATVDFTAPTSAILTETRSLSSPWAKLWRIPASGPTGGYLLPPDDPIEASRCFLRRPQDARRVRLAPRRTQRRKPDEAIAGGRAVETPHRLEAQASWLAE